MILTIDHRCFKGYGEFMLICGFVYIRILNLKDFFLFN